MYKLKDPKTKKPKKEQEVQIIENRTIVISETTQEQLEASLANWKTKEIQAAENVAKLKQDLINLKKVLK